MSDTDDDDGTIKLSSLFSEAYYPAFASQRKYNFIKGAKGSGKSYFMAIMLVMKMMQHPEANVLVIRKTKESLRGSCFNAL